MYEELLPQGVELLSEINEPIKDPTSALNNLAQAYRQLYEEIRRDYEPKPYTGAFIRLNAPSQSWQMPTFQSYLSEIESLDPLKCCYITHAIFQCKVYHSN